MMFGFSVIALFWATLLLLAILRPNHLRILRLRFLREAGKLSYCLYLIHMDGHSIIAQGLRRFGSNGGFSYHTQLFIFAIGYMAMFLFARLSWDYFESSMVKIGHHFQFSTAHSQLPLSIDVRLFIADCEAQHHVPDVVNVGHRS